MTEETSNEEKPEAIVHDLASSLLPLSSCRSRRETAYHTVQYYESHNAVKGGLVYDTANVRFVFYSSEEAI